MPLKLINYQTVKDEKQWTYELKITFNSKKINFVTITNYFQTKPGRQKITKELIMELLKRLNNRRLRPTNYPYQKVFKWETTYQNTSYRLIFWFKKKTTNHLWIKNCFQID